MPKNPLNVTLIPSQRVPVTDETGQMSREWYRYFLNLFYLAGNGSNPLSLLDIQYGPPSTPLEAIAIDPNAPDNGPTNSPLISQTAEMEKQIEGLQSLPSSPDIDFCAAMETQIQGLQSSPLPPLGTMAQLQQANLPWVTYDTTPQSLPTSVGTMAWDGGTTMGLQMTANVLQKIGEDYFYYIKADAAITKGQLVMFAGAVGSSGVLKGKPSTGVTNGQYIMGIAAETLALNDFGLVQAFGVLRGINTTGSSVGETWIDGDVLYYNSAYTGGLTNVFPTSGPIVIAAAVINAGSGGSGSLQVRVSVTQRLTAGAGISVTQTATATTIANGLSTAPVTKTANFSVATGETWLINNKAGSTCTVTLPAASAITGRVLYFQNYQAYTLVSASSNVVPLAGGAASTAILNAVAGDTATLVSDGTNWIMTQYVPNNVLLLE